MLRPLDTWLNRRAPLPSRFYRNEDCNSNGPDRIDDRWVAGVCVEVRRALYEADTIEWRSLAQSRAQTLAYLVAADKKIDGLQGGWLDREEAAILREELPPPPEPTLPIYLITVRGEACPERIVYIGITSSTYRFAGGHHAALKLHAPEYSGLEKYILQCSLYLNVDHDYLPLEWIDPETLSFELLNSIESQLIHHFQPELNSRKKNRCIARYPIQISLQNIIEPEKGSFLDSEVVIP